MYNHYVLRGLGRSPEWMKQLVAGSSDIADMRPDPDRFTPREVVAHLADWEPILRTRITDALTGKRPMIQPFDEGEMAVLHGYSKKEVQESLEIWANERAKSLELLQGLKDEDWDQVYVHPEFGTVRVFEAAAMMLGHDLYHLEQIDEVRRG